MEYLVQWEMPIEADSPLEAAQKALRIHRNPESIATIFTVSWTGSDNQFAHTESVDLEEYEEE